METQPEPRQDSVQARGSARLAWILGTVAISLAMVGPCFSYLPMVAAIPLSIASIWQARAAMKLAEADEVTQAYGQTAVVSGALALSWSAVVLTIIVVLVALYFLFFVGYIGLILALVAAMPPPGAPVTP